MSPKVQKLLDTTKDRAQDEAGMIATGWVEAYGDKLQGEAPNVEYDMVQVARELLVARLRIKQLVEMGFIDSEDLGEVDEEVERLLTP